MRSPRGGTCGNCTHESMPSARRSTCLLKSSFNIWGLLKKNLSNNKLGALSMATLLLRIVTVPAGEAPLWVREKWVGLSLPLAQSSKSAHTSLTAGVLSGPKCLLSSMWALVCGRLKRETGFSVDAQAAVAVLAEKSPEAAAWWRENVPHLMRPGRKLMFQREAAVVCEPKALSGASAYQPDAADGDR